ncbi:MAG TPA: hypothetical protein VHE35_07470 [Kofleriaceae bacterium]|nr:hypothetical protein [Kofleriaceae bacterium]
MFEKLLKKLAGGVQIPVGVPLDDDGFLDRRCPAARCESEFKVLCEDWRTKVPDHAAWCPFCGHRDTPREFTTPEQVEFLKKAAFAEFSRMFAQELQDGARDFNRRQPRNGFLSLRLDVRSSRPQHPMPPAAAEMMKTQVTCLRCTCRFRVVGAAFFCPACGHSSAEQTFEQTVARVRKSVTLLGELAPTLSRDDLAVLSSQLLEGGLADLVSTFQHLGELLFPRLPGAAGVRLRRNVFQNLVDGSAVWVAAGGRAFAAMVDAADLDDLERLFQQRHVLEHREGFVDQSYLDKSGDRDYAPGSRLVVKEAWVVRCADVVEKLGAGLRIDAP